MLDARDAIATDAMKCLDYKTRFSSTHRRKEMTRFTQASFDKGGIRNVCYF